MKPKLILAFDPPVDVKISAESDFDVIYEGQKNMTVPRIIELANQYQVGFIMVSHGQKFTATDINQLPKSVKILATTSVGYDNLDIVSLKSREIFATNTPDVLTAATADLTLLLMLGACRRVRDAVHLSENGWGRMLAQGEMLGLDLTGKRLGILGMGRIGQAVAKRAQAFGIEVLYCNRSRLPATEENGAKYFASFHEMLPHCQILSLHAPATGQTTKIMGPAEFALLPKNAIFINVARGSLVDEDALFASLNSKHLFAAGVDVCLNEPNPDPRFLSFPNILLTPHIGSATIETRVAMGLRALANIRNVVQGLKPVDSLG